MENTVNEHSPKDSLEMNENQKSKNIQLKIFIYSKYSTPHGQLDAKHDSTNMQLSWIDWMNVINFRLNIL